MSKSIKNIVPVYKTRNHKMGQIGLDVFKLEDKIGNSYNAREMHRHEFFEFFVFTEAKGSHEIDFQTFPLKNNSVHIVVPGQIHRLSFAKLCGYAICFTEDFLISTTKKKLQSQYPFFENTTTPLYALDAKANKILLDSIKKLYKEFINFNYDDIDFLKYHLHIVLLQFKFICATAKSPTVTSLKNNAHITAFKRLIEYNYLQHLSIAEYASQLNVSTNYLNALCKKHGGISAIQLSQQRLLLEAKRMLVISDLSIKEIAFALNFKEVNYFIRFFKKHTLQTPVAYRNTRLK